MNLLNVLPGAVAQGLVWGIMAIGVYITYKILDIADLTVDGSICTGAAVCTVAIIHGINIWIAMLFAILAGVLTGLVTGLFHTLLGIPAILSGILTQLILWSVNLKILGKANLGLPSKTYKVLISALNNNNAMVILFAFAVVVILLLYLFFGTELGCSLRATGNNINMSRAQGINTGAKKVIGLALSNGIVALSGALLCQYQGYADINMGRGAIVIGLAAVIIGEALIGRHFKNFAVHLFSVLVGGVIYFLVYQIVIFLGLDTDYLKMLSALIVAIFLGIPYLRSKIKGVRVKKVRADNA